MTLHTTTHKFWLRDTTYNNTTYNNTEDSVTLQDATTLRDLKTTRRLNSAWHYKMPHFCVTLQDTTTSFKARAHRACPWHQKTAISQACPWHHNAAWPENNDKNMRQRQSLNNHKNMRQRAESSLPHKLHSDEKQHIKHETESRIFFHSFFNLKVRRGNKRWETTTR